MDSVLQTLHTGRTKPPTLIRLLIVFFVLQNVTLPIQINGTRFLLAFCRNGAGNERPWSDIFKDVSGHFSTSWTEVASKALATEMNGVGTSLLSPGLYITFMGLVNL